MTQDDLETLEGLVDRHTLAQVIESLAEIATLKAEHLVGNWQDNESAGAWEDANKVLERAAFRLSNLGF